ncbi:MAG: hypothetical protein JSS58_00095 [Proteobacteria bacterium]|nr:hypothetical protein [Pseudomonadota bacterium]
MHSIIKSIALSGLLLAAASAHAVDVGVTVSGQIKPGVYGQVNVGTAPPPLVYAQPVLVVPQPQPMTPIYLNVPPGHAKHWSKHCRQYNACGRPVYFVKTAEYERGYRPPRHGYDHENSQGDQGNGHGKHGKGHGYGHDKHHKHHDDDD